VEQVKRLLLNNKAWANEKTELKPNYFKELALDQNPGFLWIGCSDSRVPAEEVTGTQPGEIFVHRNIANLVVHTDFNLLSVLQYAVDFLKVRHVIVCGHYGCGGVRAALTPQRFGFLNKWLRHLKDIYHVHSKELDAVTDPLKKTNLMVEHSVRHQVHNLAKTSIIQRAWLKEKRPILHGWVFALDTGILNPLCQMNPGDAIEPIYKYDFSDEL